MNDDKTVIKYDDIPLPEKVSDILKHDIWVGRQFLHLDVLFHNESDKVFGIGHNIPQERGIAPPTST